MLSAPFLFMACSAFGIKNGLKVLAISCLIAAWLIIGLRLTLDK